ncbi:MAG: hypothetical protein ACJ79H_09065 [Myxococcales bacterium]
MPIRWNDLRSLCCALALAAAGFACSVNEIGKIPCRDTSNCPSDYPTCSAAGFCVDNAAAARIDVVSGNAQTAVVGTALTQPLVVKVSDTNGNAVASFGLAWAVTAGTGQVSIGTATTSPDGKASITATVGTVAGVNSFGVTGSGVAGQTFTATGLPDSATQLALGGPTSITAGDAQAFTLTAKDQYGNVATAYRGTVTFASSDGAATLPTTYTFSADDSGIHQFSVTLKTAGARSVTAADGSITGTQAGILVNPGATTNLLVTSYPSPASADIGGSVTVTAKDANNNTTPAYTGTVQFTSTNGNASLPGEYAFTGNGGDAGVHTFSGVHLKKASPPTFSITVTDTVNAAITGNQSGITVNPGAASQLLLTGFPSPASADTGGTLTVTAADANGNITPAYTGTVQFSSTNPSRTLPGSYTFTGIGGDDGAHTFAGVVLKKASPPSYSITATDGTITGSQTGIVVNAGATTKLLVTGFPSTVFGGTPGTVTVSAQDANDNPTPAYTGTITFASDNPNAILPVDYTFTGIGGDDGTQTFSGVILKKASPPSYFISATDTVATSITGSETGIAVDPGATKLRVTGFPNPVFAGTPGSVIVSAQNADDSTAMTYRGTVHFSSSDGTAILPLDHDFTASDVGAHTFSAVILNATDGAASIAVNDAVNGAVTGSQAGIVVNAGPLGFGMTATAVSGGAKDGQIFISGGSLVAAGTNPRSNTWFYNPADSSLAAGPALAFARAFHTATPIGGGQVLVAGGKSGATGFTEFELCSLNDPTPSCASTGGTVATSRCNAAAALVSATQVLVAGGDICAGATGVDTWDLWDSTAPTTLVSNNGANNLKVRRRLLTATVVGTGKVLLAGGAATATADLFTLGAPSTVAAITGGMLVIRVGHTATVLTSSVATTACPTGSATNSCVLIAGGTSVAGKTWEVYDPSTNTFPTTTRASIGNDLATPRSNHAAAAFADGKVLLAGGTDGLIALKTTEIFDPAALALTFGLGPGLQLQRSRAAAAYSPAQNVLVLVGGSAVGPSTEQVTTP